MSEKAKRRWDERVAEFLLTEGLGETYVRFFAASRAWFVKTTIGLAFASCAVAVVASFDPRAAYGLAESLLVFAAMTGIGGAIGYLLAAGPASGAVVETLVDDRWRRQALDPATFVDRYRRTRGGRWDLLITGGAVVLVFAGHMLGAFRPAFLLIGLIWGFHLRQRACLTQVWLLLCGVPRRGRSLLRCPRRAGVRGSSVGVGVGA